MARLILDTGVLVAAVRGQLDPNELTDEDDITVPMVVIAEFRTGVLLDPDPARRAVQQAFLNEVLSTVSIEDYDPTIAEHHAELLAHVRRTGQRRGAHDLIIAATARATGRELLTTDEKARFHDLPDVSARLLTCSPS